MAFGTPFSRLSFGLSVLEILMPGKAALSTFSALSAQAVGLVCALSAHSSIAELTLAVSSLFTITAGESPQGRFPPL